MKLHTSFYIIITIVFLILIPLWWELFLIAKRNIINLFENIFYRDEQNNEPPIHKI